MILPYDLAQYAQRVTTIDDEDSAFHLVDIAAQMELSCVGVAVIYQTSRPAVATTGGRTWSDPRSIRPLFMVLSLDPGSCGDVSEVCTFVVDLNNADVRTLLADVLRQPVPFVGHDLKQTFFCLWALGLPVPRIVWDTWTAERAFSLGKHHARYIDKQTDDHRRQAQNRNRVEFEIDRECSLPQTCERYDTPVPGQAVRALLAGKLADRGNGFWGSRDQLAAAVARAEIAAKLYPLEVVKALELNALDHLKAVEMPWTITNAEFTWTGVRVDAELCRSVHAACARHTRTLDSRLRERGISNVDGGPQLANFFRSIGLLDSFPDRSNQSFDDAFLDQNEHHDPALADIRELRRVRRLRSDKLLSGELVGADGRVHPDHRQFGAESGRNSMRDPNIGGIGRMLRPLVVPEDPALFAIGEVDLCQIEVLVAAGETGDPELVRMVNAGDVYTAMARTYYRERLSVEDLALTDDDFKRRYRGDRERMKVFTLSIIYNVTASTLASQLSISVHQAERERLAFLGMFPTLATTLHEFSEFGAIRGYAQICTGLRRYRGASGELSQWEKNWMRNTPIQGSACALFKIAGNRLRERYRPYGAKLIIPLHDAYVFECPLTSLEEVARVTSEVMTGVVGEYYPALTPRVDVNISHPHCWNKDHKIEPLTRWIDDPRHARAYMRS